MMHPAHFSDYIVYVDESGNASLKSIDPAFPVFALVFCIFRKEAYASEIVPAIQRFKFEHFGHDAVILHEHEIYRQHTPFRFLKEPTRRAVFLAELDRIVRAADFTVVAAVIDKAKLVRRHGRRGRDPYELALLFCMERTQAFLTEVGEVRRRTHIVVEQRGGGDDARLALAFRGIASGDNHWGSPLDLELVLASKRINSAGLQLADLIARPIARHVVNPGQRNRAYDTISTKLRRGPDGGTAGWGLKTYPE